MKFRRLFAAFAIVGALSVGMVGTAAADPVGLPKSLTAEKVCPRADAIQTRIDRVQAVLQRNIDRVIARRGADAPVVRGLQRALDKVNAGEVRFQAYVAANCAV